MGKMRVPVGDMTDPAKVANGFFEAGILGSGFGERFGLSPFVNILGHDLVDVKARMMGPLLMRAVRTVAPQQTDRTGFVTRHEIEAYGKVLRKLGVLAEKHSERMLPVHGLK